MCVLGNRYCQDAVDSVEIVTTCPTSKTEWEIAAYKKNCERIVSRQKCDSVERFKYHCVINGFRNELVEVCAPSRIIFGKKKMNYREKTSMFIKFILWIFFNKKSFKRCLLFNDLQDIVQSLMFRVELFKIRCRLPATIRFQNVTRSINHRMRTNVWSQNFLYSTEE